MRTCFKSIFFLNVNCYGVRGWCTVRVLDVTATFFELPFSCIRSISINVCLMYIHDLKLISILLLFSILTMYSSLVAQTKWVLLSDHVCNQYFMHGNVVLVYWKTDFIKLMFILIIKSLFMFIIMSLRWNSKIRSLSISMLYL